MPSSQRLWNHITERTVNKLADSGKSHRKPHRLQSSHAAVVLDGRNDKNPRKLRKPGRISALSGPPAQTDGQRLLRNQLQRRKLFDQRHASDRWRIGMLTITGGADIRRTK